MANELRMASNISVLQDVVEGDYSILQHDLLANSKTWGGKYSMPAYDNDAVAYWESAVIDVTTATGLADGTAFEGNAAVDAGTVPVKVTGIAVEYTSELGTVGDVVITIGTQVMAELDVGEGIFIPISGASGVGLAVANVKIHADVYSDGVNEATVNVMLVGLNA
jgi:hypothetical protein